MEITLTRLDVFELKKAAWDTNGAANNAAPAKNRVQRTARLWWSLLLLLFVPIGVNRGELLPFFRQIFQSEDGGHRTNWDACAAIDALNRADVQHGLVLESRFVLAWMDAVHGTDINTGSVFGVDAGFGNHVSHSQSPLRTSEPGVDSRV
jgi:hypothetical protein